jgi:hypothetical protein
MSNDACAFDRWFVVQLRTAATLSVGVRPSSKLTGHCLNGLLNETSSQITLNVACLLPVLAATPKLKALISASVTVRAIGGSVKGDAAQKPQGI